MKRLLILLAFLALPVSVWAQVAQVKTATTSPIMANGTGMVQGDRQCIALRGNTAYSHAFIFTTRATTSTILVTFSGSTDGSTPGSTITTDATTAGNLVTFTGVYTNLCITVTTLTGTGAKVDYAYAGDATTGTAVSVAALSLAQGSTTSGQTGPLVQCATTTAAPTYTTAKTNPCSTNTSGELRTTLSALPAFSATPSVKIQGTNGETISAVTDPCDGVLTTGADLHLASTTVTILVTATSAKKNYICSMDIVVGGTAEIISLVEGTGANCGSGTAVLWGSATAANGFPFGANGGIARSRTISGKTANVNTCVQSSGANAFTIHIEYVQL